MEEYRKSFIKEYNELSERVTKLNNTLKKYKNGELPLDPNRPYKLLYIQLIYMVNYLHTLERRAEIEGIKL